MSAIEINTTQYEFSHGKQPRGYGCWFFFTDRACRDFDSAMQFSGTYAECKSRALQVARERKIDLLYVGP